MTKTTISMIGLDEDRYAKLNRKEMRLIDFPDALARAITLRVRQWEIYDQRKQQRPRWMAGAEERVFIYAQAQCGIIEKPSWVKLGLDFCPKEDFEKILRAVFEAQITAEMNRTHKRLFPIANSNSTKRA